MRARFPMMMLIATAIFLCLGAFLLVRDPLALKQFSAKAGPVYIIDHTNPQEPAKVVQEKPSGEQVMMRDPNLFPTQNRKPVSAKRVEPPPPPKAAVHQFQPREIVGRTTQPRVEFDREMLEIGQVEQARTINYLQKLIDSRPPDF